MENTENRMHFQCLIVDDELTIAQTTSEYFNLFELPSAYVTNYDACLKFLENNTVSLILLAKVKAYLKRCQSVSASKEESQLLGAGPISIDLSARHTSRPFGAWDTAWNSNSKRELTASLSHDIKTPVTSIKLVGELLLTTEPEGGTKNKIRTIYQKADQIDYLVSNLLQSSLEDLGELTVSVSDESSGIVEEWITQSDCYGTIHCNPVPGCIIRADRQRLCQVLDNILYNSYKYAGTPITVEFILGERELNGMIKDTGKGVPDEELPLLFQKYYRGSNSQNNQTEGSGSAFRR